MRSEVLGIRLPPTKKKQFEAVCEQLETVPSAVIRQLIDIYLKQAPTLIKKHRQQKAELLEFLGDVNREFFRDNKAELLDGEELV
jgi:hypothetical protein